jgi:hypothetical protein
MKKTLLSIFLIAIFIGSVLSQSTISQTIETDSIITNNFENLIIEMVNKINNSQIKKYHNDLMDFGARFTGSENCTMAGDYIYNEFQKMWLEVEFHNWEVGRFKSRNVVATLKGQDEKFNAVYIFSAHYDCTPGSLGADDDGSGVAAVLAVANILSKYQFNHTIKFIAFSGEEVGTFGSFAYAEDAYNRGENIIAVINPDMIGYADTTEGGNILRFFYPERSYWIAKEAKVIGEKYYDLIEINIETLPNYIGADHQAFIDYGYDGVWIAHRDSYPWGNTPEDTPEKINFTYLEKATKFLLAFLVESANRAMDVQIMLKNPLEGTGYLFDTPIFDLSLEKHWYRELRGITLILGGAVAKAEVISNQDISYVIFCINNNFMYWDSTPPYEWEIEGKHFPPIGKVKLRVYAYTKSGNFATDEMDIIIFTLKCQYC